MATGVVRGKLKWHHRIAQAQKLEVKMAWCTFISEQRRGPQTSRARGNLPHLPFPLDGPDSGLKRSGHSGVAKAPSSAINNRTNDEKDNHYHYDERRQRGDQPGQPISHLNRVPAYVSRPRTTCILIDHWIIPTAGCQHCQQQPLQSNGQPPVTTTTTTTLATKARPVTPTTTTDKALVRRENEAQQSYHSKPNGGHVFQQSR